MSQVVSMRLKEGQVDRLKRLARRWGRTPSEVSAKLVEEALRREEFAFVEFADSPAGREATMQGGPAVWEVVMVLGDFDWDVERVARDYPWPVERIRAALNYYAAFREEIDQELADNDARDFEHVSRALPGARQFRVSPAGESPASGEGEHAAPAA